MTVLLCILWILSILVIFASLVIFDRTHKVDFTASKKGLDITIDYEKLTFAKALELKNEYEREGYSCYIVVRSRKGKK